MFIRVRKLSLRSVFFDVAQSVRVGQKTRNRIMFSLGALGRHRDGDFWIKAASSIAASGLPPAEQKELVGKLLCHVPCPPMPVMLPATQENLFHNVDASMWLDKFDKAGRPDLPFSQGCYSAKVQNYLEQIEEWSTGRLCTECRPWQKA